jgi:hypothetical protein
MKTSILLGAMCAAALAGPVLAQTEVERATVVESHTGSHVAGGAATGAVAGAVVGGPVGAAVGAGVGAVVGAATAPPKEVRTYVTARDDRPITYEGEIVVGRHIDRQVTWMDIPDQPKYRWAYLGDKRVVIDTETNTVVAVY